MAALSKENEELIHKFIGLSTADQQGPLVRLTREASNVTDWSTCLLLKVITNRTVTDSAFSSAMVTTWHADPETAVSPLSKGSYMVQFVNKEEMLKV